MMDRPLVDAAPAEACCGWRRVAEDDGVDDECRRSCAIARGLRSARWWREDSRIQRPLVLRRLVARLLEERHTRSTHCAERALVTANRYWPLTRRRASAGALGVGQAAIGVFGLFLLLALVCLHALGAQAGAQLLDAPRLGFFEGLDVYLSDRGAGWEEAGGRGAMHEVAEIP